MSALCTEVGYVTAEQCAIETLCEMLQSYLIELGRSSRAFGELSGRTQPMLSDVVLAMIEMGIDVESIPAYANRQNRKVIQPCMTSLPVPNPRNLSAGEKQSHPVHIPDYLPLFPDPHTYIKTPTHKPPVTEYQIVRERAASQKRDVERALTRFIAKTGETESLFQDDPYAFPLIANKPKALPYLDSLLPKDQEWDEGHETEAVDLHPLQETHHDKVQREAAETADKIETSQQSAANLSTSVEAEGQIDNPYLRAIKMPKLKSGKKCKY